MGNQTIEDGKKADKEMRMNEDGKEAGTEEDNNYCREAAIVHERDEIVDDGKASTSNLKENNAVDKEEELDFLSGATDIDPISAVLVAKQVVEDKTTTETLTAISDAKENATCQQKDESKQLEQDDIWKPSAIDEEVKDGIQAKSNVPRTDSDDTDGITMMADDDHSGSIATEDDNKLSEIVAQGESYISMKEKEA